MQQRNICSPRSTKHKYIHATKSYPVMLYPYEAGPKHHKLGLKGHMLTKTYHYATDQNILLSQTARKLTLASDLIVNDISQIMHDFVYELGRIIQLLS